MRRRGYLAVLGLGWCGGCLRLQGAKSTPTPKTVFEVKYATDDGTLETIHTADGVARVSSPRRRKGVSGWSISLTLTRQAAIRFVRTLRRAGAFENPDEHPIFVFLRQKAVHSFILSDGLIQTMQNGEFQEERTLLLTFENETVAKKVSATLQGR